MSETAGPGPAVPGHGDLGFPDVVLAGAARSGTSFLAARLGKHPAVDGGIVKEPNYFSRNLERGVEWYDGLYEPRREGLLRLDASVSYTAPQHPEALAALAAAAPGARVIYAVRDPLERAVSHFRLLREYFSVEDEPDFGTAITRNEVYLGSSDYDRWLGELAQHWPASQRLVVPFALTTGGSSEATDVIFDWLGLPPVALDETAGSEHRHEVVEFRSDLVRRARRAVVRSGAYPLARRVVGPARMRRLRARLTKKAETLTVEQALASCSVEQRAEIDALVARSRTAALAALQEQDARTGLSWAPRWSAGWSTGGPTAPGSAATS